MALAPPLIPPRRKTITDLIERDRRCYIDTTFRHSAAAAAAQGTGGCQSDMHCPPPAKKEKPKRMRICFGPNEEGEEEETGRRK